MLCKRLCLLPPWRERAYVLSCAWLRGRVRCQGLGGEHPRSRVTPTTVMDVNRMQSLPLVDRVRYSISVFCLDCQNTSKEKKCSLRMTLSLSVSIQAISPLLVISLCQYLYRSYMYYTQMQIQYGNTVLRRHIQWAYTVHTYTVHTT